MASIGQEKEPLHHRHDDDGAAQTTKPEEEEEEVRDRMGRGEEKKQQQSWDTQAVEAEEEPTYSDEFVDIGPKGITIKWYYFPVGTSKVVPWEHVEGWERRSYRGLIASVDYKSWGMGLSDVWCACDMKRYWNQRDMVVVTTGSWIRKGFSCHDPATALRLIAYYASRARRQ